MKRKTPQRSKGQSAREQLRALQKATHHNCYCKKYKNRKNRSIAFTDADLLSKRAHNKISGAQSHNVCFWETKRKRLELINAGLV